MGIFHGDTEIESVHHGDTEIGSIYRGDTLIWEEEAPGPTLIGGDLQAGYYGTVLSADFIAGDTLASDIGLTAGTAYNDDTPWLKFAWNGGIVMVPQKSLRYNISWDQIHAENAAYGGASAPVVTINGNDYRVRLFQVANQDPVSYPLVGSEYWDSEWNRLMLPIHVNAPNSWAYPEYVDGSTEDWGIDFTDDDLLTHYDYGNGNETWGQEQLSTYAYRIGRGSSGVSRASYGNADGTNDGNGWRPLLTQL